MTGCHGNTKKEHPVSFLMGVGSDIRESCLQRALGGLRSKDDTELAGQKGVWVKNVVHAGKKHLQCPASRGTRSRNVLRVAGAKRGQKEGTAGSGRAGVGGCCCEVKQGQTEKSALEFSNKLLRRTSWSGSVVKNLACQCRGPVQSLQYPVHQSY